MLLLLKGCQGGGYRGKAGMPGRAAHLELCQQVIPAYRTNTPPPHPPTPLLWAGTAKLSPEPAHHTSSFSTVIAASNSPRPEISRQLPGEAGETCSKITCPLPKEDLSSVGLFQRSARTGERPSASRAQLWSPPQQCWYKTESRCGFHESDNFLRHRKLQTQRVPPYRPALT